MRSHVERSAKLDGRTATCFVPFQLFPQNAGTFSRWNRCPAGSPMERFLPSHATHTHLNALSTPPHLISSSERRKDCYLVISAMCFVQHKNELPVAKNKSKSIHNPSRVMMCSSAAYRNRSTSPTPNRVMSTCLTLARVYRPQQLLKLLTSTMPFST